MLNESVNCCYVRHVATYIQASAPMYNVCRVFYAHNIYPILYLVFQVVQ